MGIIADPGRTIALVAATWAIEAVVLRRLHGERFGRRSLIDLFWINLLTNPAANYAYGELGWNWWLVEMAVVVAEAWPIGRSLRVTLPRGFALSLLVNGASAGVGRIVEAIVTSA